MGDGSVDRTSTNPRISCSNTKKKYLDYLDKQFPVIGLGVKLENSAKECAERDRCSGFNKTASADQYSDMYRWRTRTHPELAEFGNWYKGGYKLFPENISLSPVLLKHWYVCDGSYINHNYNSHIVIGISNERENIDKIKKYFSTQDLPEPKVSSSVRSNGSINTSIRWTVCGSLELFDYMGEPLPGFEYKWRLDS